MFVTTFAVGGFPPIHGFATFAGNLRINDNMAKKYIEEMDVTVL